jgi:hypothetical protein
VSHFGMQVCLRLSAPSGIFAIQMPTPTIFDLCTPRDDVLRDAITESDFAADLNKVLSPTDLGDYRDYREAGPFFANTYPTRGLKNLLHNVLSRLSGTGGEAASIFRLDTSFGGGKTHALIALVHAARGMSGVPNVVEFADPALVPTAGIVKIAAFDGENADPSNGRTLENGLLAKTPWGELAYALAGRAGFERVRASDEQQRAPGAATIAELFEGRPTLILLDELAVYLRKVAGIPHARDQFAAFLTDLFKAVESSPKVALVFTLALSREGRAVDAYSDEQQFIADKFAELESVAARKATLLNPTEDDETVHVLRRRLFAHIDDSRVAEVAEAYRQVWATSRDRLPAEAQRPEVVEKLLTGYPFHPHILETLTLKTATLANFQRVRGMLRLLARTIAQLWRARPSDATAIHLHHVDLGVEAIRQELITRLGLTQLVPALNSDVASSDAGHQALAKALDAKLFANLPPYGSYVGRTILIHTIAFNEPLKGATPDELRFAIAAPTLDLSFVDQARKAFLEESAYLDDRPTAPMRFLTEANLNQVVRREEQIVDPSDARAQLKDRIREIFRGETLELIQFPAGPFDVPDEIADGRPRVAVMSHDALTVGGTVDAVPDLVARIYQNKGSDGTGIRGLRNNVIFVVADEGRVDEMRHRMIRRLALRSLLTPDRLGQLAEHQQSRVRELEKRSEQELAIAIQQAYRHVFYPSRNRLGDGTVDLAHMALDLQSTSDSPGAGQLQVVRGLRDLSKIRLREDQPDAPAYVRDRTPLRNGRTTTMALRDEFRRDPALPIIAHDDVFIRGVRMGIDTGEFVYVRNSLMWGKGDPAASIMVDEQSFLYTTAEAKREGFWPRRAEPVPDTGGGTPVGPGGGGPPSVSPVTGSDGGRGLESEAILAGPGVFSAEGPLRGALTQLWENARGAKVTQVGVLQLRLFDTSDAFKLISVMDTIAQSSKEVTLEGGYESADGCEFQFTFKGGIGDANQLKAFLEPQLRAAKDKDFKAAITLRFDAGLSLAGRAPEDLTEKLTRIASGAVHVQASAEGRA